MGNSLRPVNFRTTVLGKFAPCLPLTLSPWSCFLALYYTQLGAIGQLFAPGIGISGVTCMNGDTHTGLWNMVTQ